MALKVDFHPLASTPPFRKFSFPSGGQRENYAPPPPQTPKHKFCLNSPTFPTETSWSRPGFNFEGFNFLSERGNFSPFPSFNFADQEREKRHPNFLREVGGGGQTCLFLSSSSFSFLNGFGACRQQCHFPLQKWEEKGSASNPILSVATKASCTLSKKDFVREMECL